MRDERDAQTAEESSQARKPENRPETVEIGGSKGLRIRTGIKAGQSSQPLLE
jgi:hypothetical protein